MHEEAGFSLVAGGRIILMHADKILSAIIRQHISQHLLDYEFQTIRLNFEDFVTVTISGYILNDILILLTFPLPDRRYNVCLLVCFYHFFNGRKLSFINMKKMFKSILHTGPLRYKTFSDIKGIDDLYVFNFVSALYVI